MSLILMSSRKMNQTKRKLPVAKRHQLSEKRQKLAPAKQLTTVDSLPWNPVQLPENFEDAEGFYGLEEIDDVEIIRHGGAVQFSSTKCMKIDDVEDGFEGFSDEGSTRETIPDVHSTKAGKSRNKTPKSVAKGSKDGKVPQMPSKQASTFDILGRHEDPKEEDISAWRSLALSDDVLSALSKLGFSKPTAIQSAAIPDILRGHDVVGKAATGSGKTLAFGIPIIESWLEFHNATGIGDDVITAKAPTALILSPTRELAHQLTQHITNLCTLLPVAPHVTAVTGGLSLQKQQRLLAKADIIVATPGRLWELMSTSVEISSSVKQIKFLVTDEADRLLSDGHFKEMKDILTALDRQVLIDEDDDIAIKTSRQTLVFSATFNRNLQQKLTGKGRQALVDKAGSMEYLLKFLNFREEKPRFVDVNPISQMVEKLKERIVECGGTEKDLYLYALLLFYRGQRALVFTNSIYSVRRLTPFLQALGLSTQALHSQMIQKARMRSVERFSSPKDPGSILVATDVAARGLDIEGVELILHYHLPRAADTYVHRSGRTARGESSGASILLCAPEEVIGTRRLVAKVHAQNASSAGGSTSKYYMRSLDIDRKVVARLRPRVDLAKMIADSALAKNKKGHDNEWIRSAAAELGVDYDSEEFEAAGGERKGRGTGRKLKEKQARSLSKADLGALRAELKQLLAQRVNIGVSENYLTSGTVDVNELLNGAEGDFLGRVDGVGTGLQDG